MQAEEEIKKKLLKRCREAFGKQMTEHQNKQTVAQCIFLTFLMGIFTLCIPQWGDTQEKTCPESAADPLSGALDQITLPRIQIIWLRGIYAFISKPRIPNNRHEDCSKFWSEVQHRWSFSVLWPWPQAALIVQRAARAFFNVNNCQAKSPSWFRYFLHLAEKKKTYHEWTVLPCRENPQVQPE